MTHAKHTPGPWYHNGYGDVIDGQGRVIVNSGHIHAYDVRNPAYENPKQLIACDDGGEANAALIAAAPDLLEALEITLNEAEDQCGQLDVDTLGILRDAIAKAGRIRP